jgi:hypothetical protein
MMEIAQHLCDSNSYGSLGMLGLASRSLHENITPLFYQTMVCDRASPIDEESDDGQLIKESTQELPLEKWKYAK